MFKKLLVPLDGSELSASILPRVIAVAEPAGAEVALLQVVEPLERGVREEMGEDLAVKLDVVKHEELTAYLERAGAVLENRGLRIVIATAEGKPAETIIDYATVHDMDLIIMATHGRSGLSRWAFGSVAEKVLRHSPVPVLIAPVAGARAQRL
jgi:nucleotide-binding universal stress UspA family protein